jgi:predicted outer membrane repeat protein
MAQLQDPASASAVLWGRDPNRYSFTALLIAGSLAAFAGSSTGVLARVNVTNARSELGAVLSAGQSSKVACNACILASNTALYAGGAVAASGTSLIDLLGGDELNGNQASYGGAAWIQDTSRLRMSGGSLVANGMGYLAGGGIAAVMQSSVELNRMTASSNQAAFQGGFLLARDQSSVRITNGTNMTDNAALSGGAASFLNQVNATGIDLRCESNRAMASGGCLNINGSSFVFLQGGTFRRNTASLGGFGGMQAGASLILSGATCDSNVATNSLLPGMFPISQGGCIQAESAQLILTDSVFVNNTALDDNPSDDSDGYGGAIRSALSDLTLSRCLFTQNFADFLGGAIQAVLSTLLDDGSVYRGNTASMRAPAFQPAAQRALPRDRNAAFSGALDLARTPVTLRGVFLLDNFADHRAGALRIFISPSIIEDCIFRNNTAIRGGAIYMQNSDIVSLIRTECARNIALLGGCLFAVGVSQLSLDSSRIIGNMAVYDVNTYIFLDLGLPAYGGGVLAGTVADMQVTNTTFRSNLAMYCGGGLYVEATAVTLNAGVVAIKNVGMAGGFMAAIGATTRVTITGLDCRNNTSTAFLSSDLNSGGCIYSIKILEMRIQDSILAGNLQINEFGARGQGAAISDVSSVSVQLRNVTLSDNVSSFYAAGAVFHRTVSIRISSCTFFRNVASHSSGVDVGVFGDWEGRVDGDANILVQDSSFSGTVGASLDFERAVDMVVTLQRCRWTQVQGMLVIHADARVSIRILDSEVAGAYVFVLWLTAQVPEFPLRVTIVNTTFDSVRQGSKVEDGASGSFFNQGAILEITASQFTHVITDRTSALFEMQANAKLRIVDSGFRAVEGKAIVHCTESSSTQLKGVSVSDTTFLERGILWATSPRATAQASNISISDVSSRCGIAACIEDAALVEIVDVRVDRASCRAGDPALSFFSTDCALVTSRASNSNLVVRGVRAVGFAPWILFALVSARGVVDIADVSIRDAGSSGGFRVTSLDGGGNFSARNVSALNIAQEGPLFLIEYIGTSAWALSRNGSTNGANVLSVALTNVAVRNLSLSQEAGGIVSLSPLSLLKVTANQPSLNASSSASAIQIDISNLVAEHSAAVRGGSILSCSGLWNVSVRDAMLYNITASGAATAGGAVVLRNGCRLTMTRIQSNVTIASAGGFASVQSGSSLGMARVSIAGSFAMGSLAPRSAQTQALLASSSFSSSALASRAIDSGWCTLLQSTVNALEQSSAFVDQQVGNTLAWQPAAGGAILLDAASRLSISDSVFQDSVALQSGGVVHAFGSRLNNDGLWIAASNVTTVRSTATKGGVLFLASTNASQSAHVRWGSQSNSDSCARFGTHAATSPGSLQVRFAGSRPAQGLQLWSGEYLPSLDVAVLDAFGQNFLDASFFSLVLRMQRGDATLVGKTNVFGVYGSASFGNGTVAALGRPGNYSLAIASDDLFADYPSSLLNSNVSLVILSCPTGRFVDETSLACKPCPIGTVSGAVEARQCVAVTTGFYTIDGVTVLACSDSAVDALKTQQCRSAGLPVMTIALGTVVPLCAIVAGGIAGVLFYRKKLKEAEANARPWLVNPKDIEWVRKVGEGACGEVFMCIYKATIVCVKRIKLKAQIASAGQSPLEKDIVTSQSAGTPIQNGWILESRRMQSGLSASSRPPASDKTDTTTWTVLGDTLKTQIEDENKLLEEEIELHVTLHHPNVVLFMGAIITPDNVCLMTEFMTMGG